MLSSGRALERAYVGKLRIVDYDTHSLGRVDRRAAAEGDDEVGAGGLEGRNAVLHVGNGGVGLQIAEYLVRYVGIAEYLFDLLRHAEAYEILVGYQQGLAEAALAHFVGDHRAASGPVIRCLVQNYAVHGLMLV